MSLVEPPIRKSVVFAQTPRLAICVLDQDHHLPWLCRWFNDVRVTQTLLLEQRPVSRDDEHNWLVRLKRPDCTMFALETREERTPIGIGGLHYIDWTSRNGRIFIVLGESPEWHKGYATEFRAWLVTYAFQTLNLHKLSSYVAAVNTAALKLNKHSGFTQEGELRDQLFRNGKYHSVFIYSATAPPLVLM